MFRIRNIALCKGTDQKIYNFTDNTYVYGNNSVGKTAFTKVIDFILGSTEELSHDGLDNIEEVRAYITNEKTELWIKRNIVGEFAYKRTLKSEYSLVSQDVYKNIICEIITENINEKAIQVYNKVFEECPSFRSFTFLNFLDEMGQGDLYSIFTRGQDLKHAIRIRKIMDFFFNYENIEMIYKKSVELDKLEIEYKKISDKLKAYDQSIIDIERIFAELNLNYSYDMSSNYKEFQTYITEFNRNTTNTKGDLSYLIRASHSLSEEIKISVFLKNQSNAVTKRKDRNRKLLSMLGAILSENTEYKNEIAMISNMIKEIDTDKIILSISDYDESIKKINFEKLKIDKEIKKLQNQASELDYNSTIKKIALLEKDFSIINSGIDINKAQTLSEQIVQLKNEIKILKNNYSHKDIDDFNKRLTEMYLTNDIRHVNYLNDDREQVDFRLKFNPFSQALLAYHKENNVDVAFIPGSLARHNHLQLLLYLCMHEFLHKKFTNFIYIPILIMDSPDQAMNQEYFEEIYPTLIKLANEIGIQTIFLSKNKINGIGESNLIDICNGFNPFHSKRDEI